MVTLASSSGFLVTQTMIYFFLSIKSCTCDNDVIYCRSGEVYNCCVKCITNSRACLYPGTHILYEVAYVLDSQNFEFREILKRRTESFCCDRLKSIASKIPRRQGRKIHVSTALVCILNNNNTSKNDNFFINNFSLSSMFD